LTVDWVFVFFLDS